MHVKKLTLLAIIIGMASAVHWLESLLPPVIPAFPGAKLGLANIFTLFALVKLDKKSAFIISVIRCVIGMLIGGSVTGFFYSISGAILSFIVRSIIYGTAKDKISLYGISVAGALAHNIGQVTTASLVVGSGYVFSFLPMLALLSLPAGIITGIICNILLKSLDKTGIKI